MGSASGLFAEVDAREKKQLLGGGDGAGLFGDESDSPWPGGKLFDKPIFTQKDTTSAEDADKEDDRRIVGSDQGRGRDLNCPAPYIV